MAQYQLASKINCALFRAERNANNTQLAYKAKFYPVSGEKNRDIEDSGILIWRRVFVLTKAKLLTLMNDDLTQVFLPVDVSQFPSCHSFKLHWEYNCIPTEIEWDRYSDDYKFRLEFRHIGVSDSPYVAIIGKC